MLSCASDRPCTAFCVCSSTDIHSSSGLRCDFSVFSSHLRDVCFILSPPGCTRVLTFCVAPTNKAELTISSREDVAVEVVMLTLWNRCPERRSTFSVVRRAPRILPKRHRS
ncbi:unnamed protein product [Amoebophrya sp. A120]|nr:unnamed protein product [Amoebophrya sp. A120]|eukprot:GSA120T00006420001.1